MRFFSLRITFLHTKIQSLNLTKYMDDTQNWIKEDVCKNDMKVFQNHQSDHSSLIMVETKTNKAIHYLD